MKNWKSILGICLVFILGGAAGGMITARVIHKRMQHILHGGPQVANELIVNRLTKKLSLDAAQKEKLKTIVAETRTEIQEERKQIAPQVKATLGESAKKIRAMLNPDQEKKFDDVIAKFKASSALNDK